MTVEPHEIVAFWTEAGPAKWYARDDGFDAEIRRRFEAEHHAAARGDSDGWAGSAEGALALLILLDQFPRNLYRGSAHAWATDPKARAIARAAAARGWHATVAPELRQFMLLPFEHSEDLADQDHGLALAEPLGDPEIVKWMHIHRDIIVRFGRFPHRNAALARATTAEEQAFLDSGGFSG
ncbi:MAG: DUF924 family protein [Caulobacterales bacterium]|nr:DUF924 family protein [Caulobacterales bacterium]